MEKKRSDSFSCGALVSVHDVMPETLPQVKAIIGLLERLAVFPAALLVVPGRRWSRADIAYLKSLQAAGFELAGHGWRHRAERMTSTRHRLHGLLISRNEAEHLSLSALEIAARIHACSDWFQEAGLSQPALYVPPAWAWGVLPQEAMKVLPFRLYETQWGVFDAFAGTYMRLPVTGYMADTRFREKALRACNGFSRRFFPGPLRIAIHPQDLDLRLAGDLKRDLLGPLRCLSYLQLCGSSVFPVL